MTRREAIEKHREMWRWLAKNPGRWKADYLEKFDPEANPHNCCYLCEYVAENYSEGCKYCPVEWLGGVCFNDGALYSKWLDAMLGEDYTCAAEIVKQIAELPEKEEI